MDEVSNDLSKVRAMWGTPTNSTAKAKAQRRQVEKASRKRSEHWTGRSEQLNVRVTSKLKDDAQKAAADMGMSMADFFESAVLAFIASKRGKQ
jgi:hypothetical protein